MHISLIWVVEFSTNGILFSCHFLCFHLLSDTNMHPCVLQVYKTEELQMIADLCIKHNLLCFSDEVYEWLTYDGAKHIKIGGITDYTQTS